LADARIDAFLEDMTTTRRERAAVHHRVRLRSGDEVVVRSLRPSDEDGLARMFEGLSDSSRYRRFLNGKPRVSRAALQRLMEVDHRDHEALVAVPDHGTEVIGEARYVRDSGDPAVAEMAISVADSWQRQGLGTTLARTLAHRAADEGVEEFSAEVLVDNDGIRQLIEQVGPVETSPQGSGLAVLHVSTDGHDEPLTDDRESALRQILRSAARGQFLVLPRPLRWWLRLSGRITKTLLMPVGALLGRR
jgi:RimJ/RimL family protein N-acetyltransferase